MSNTGSNENNWDINVPDEVLKTPLRLPRNAAKEDLELPQDLKNAIHEGLNIISEPKTEDVKIFTTLNDLFALFTAKFHYKNFMAQLLTKIIQDSSNASKICKYLYLLHSARKNKFILQTFNEVMRDTLNDLPDFLYCYGFFGLKSFAMYFMAGVHFMRNRASPPDDLLRSKLLEIAEMLIVSPMKTESLKTYCLLLLRYYHYCHTYDDDIKKNEGSPQRSDWSKFKKLQSLTVTGLSGRHIEADVSIFVELVKKPCLLQDHGHVSFLESFLSKSDFEDLVPSFIIWVPSSHKEYFQTTFGSLPNLHYE